MDNAQKQPTKAGWRIDEWCADSGCKRSFVYELIKEKKIESVKLGGMRVIITPPRELLARLAEQQAAA